MMFTHVFCLDNKYVNENLVEMIVVYLQSEILHFFVVETVKFFELVMYTVADPGFDLGGVLSTGVGGGGRKSLKVLTAKVKSHF